MVVISSGSRGCRESQTSATSATSAECLCVARGPVLWPPSGLYDRNWARNAGYYGASTIPIVVDVKHRATRLLRSRELLHRCGGRRSRMILPRRKHSSVSRLSLDAWATGILHSIGACSCGERNAESSDFHIRNRMAGS